MDHRRAESGFLKDEEDEEVKDDGADGDHNHIQGHHNKHQNHNQLHLLTDHQPADREASRWAHRALSLPPASWPAPGPCGTPPSH